MPDTGAPWNIPYVAASDLVKDWPTANQTLAEAIDAGLDIGLGTNVVQAIKTDTFSTTSSSYVDITDLSVTITPAAATSKVLLIAQLSVGGATQSTGMGSFRFTGGNSTGYVGDAASNRTQAVFGGQMPGNGWSEDMLYGLSLMYIDSPATTAATTYKVQGIIPTGTLYINRSQDDTDAAGRTRGASSLVAIEVAA